jgi:uncharacterized protein YdaU (DUF1376 family)
MHYYSHHIGDFLTDAGSLPNESLGAYMRMLWRYYADESPLTGEVEDIAFDAGTTPEIARQLLRRFFVKEGDAWHHVRCDKEIAKYHGKAEKAKKSADARWNGAKPKRTQCERNANAPDSDANQQPITNNQEKQEQKPLHDSLREPAKKSAKGSRLNSDWIPSDAMLAYAAANRPDVNALAETENFRDYWIAKPGAGGVKLDWEATWRTWIRRATPSSKNHNSRNGANHAAPRLSLADQAAAFHANRDRDDAIDGTFTPIDR